MEIDAVSSAGTQAGLPEQPLRTGPIAKQSLDEPPEAGEPSPTEPAGEEPNNTEKAEGVLRLLQEGHFKGVSDVRLRINFHEQLTAIETQQVKAVAENEISNVLTSVGAGIAPLLASGEPGQQPDDVSALQDGFAQTVNQLKDNFLAAEAPSKDDLVANINNAFEQLVESLWDILAPPPEMLDEEPPVDEGGEEPAGEETEEAPEAETGPDVQTYIADLEASFAAVMDDLTNSLNGVNVLPPLSQPTGNGVAYQKFLAIYNQLWGIEPTAQGADVVA